MKAGWSPRDAEAFLLERGLFGLRPGLDGIKQLLSAMGNPQDRFRSIHVVGTNGKSSTARFATALLIERGVPAGAYLSPHLSGFHQRVLLPGESGPTESDPEDFAVAIGKVAEVVTEIEREGDGSIAPTQFEIVTAAAFQLLADSGVGCAVVEAGLGGRLDATNVLAPGGIVILSSVGLDHAEWLGTTHREIAIEKLAVLKDGGHLVITSELPDGIGQLALETAELNGASLHIADPGSLDRLEMRAAGAFQRSNMALAVAAVDVLLGGSDRSAVEAVASRIEVPGRFQRLERDPRVIVDSAHNREGVEALADALREAGSEGNRIALFGVLADKDVAGMLNAIIGVVDGVVITEPGNPRALGLAGLEDECRKAGMVPLQAIANPQDALVAALDHAGPLGSVVVAGSVHLAGQILEPDVPKAVTAL